MAFRNGDSPTHNRGFIYVGTKFKFYWVCKKKIFIISY